MKKNIVCGFNLSCVGDDRAYSMINTPDEKSLADEALESALLGKKNFKIVGSAHNLKEIRIKENQKVRKIFLSSLFKKNKNFLGINKFKLISKLTKKDIIILGGVSKNNIRKLSILNHSGFAGISYFE